MPRPSKRERLLDCAEELFASRGVGAVSMRAIQSAAGLSVGSLQYHFKSESELIAAVIERRLEPLMERHEKHLEAVYSKAEPSTAQIIGALIEPLVELLRSEPERGQRYLTLMHRLQLGHQTAPVFLARWPDFAVRTRELLKRALPPMTEATLELRFDLAWETLLGSLARAAALSSEDLDEHVGALVDYLCGALEAPPTSPRVRARRNAVRKREA
jgi:AcrR family transcriptional regulator